MSHSPDRRSRQAQALPEYVARIQASLGHVDGRLDPGSFFELCVSRCVVLRTDLARFSKSILDFIALAAGGIGGNYRSASCQLHRCIDRSHGGPGVVSESGVASRTLPDLWPRRIGGNSRASGLLNTRDAGLWLRCVRDRDFDRDLFGSAQAACRCAAAPRPLGEGASHRGTSGGSCSAVAADVFGSFSYRSLCGSRLFFTRVPA